MINSGALRSRIDILIRMPTKNQYKAQEDEYTIVHESWPCRMKDVSGSFSEDKGVSVGRSEVQFFGRYREGVSRGMYASFRDKKLQITDIRPNFDMTEMTIACSKEDDRL